jgi:hypothetical protein
MYTRSQYYINHDNLLERQCLPVYSLDLQRHYKMKSSRSQSFKLMVLRPILKSLKSKSSIKELYIIPQQSRELGDWKFKFSKIRRFLSFQMLLQNVDKIPNCFLLKSLLPWEARCRTHSTRPPLDLITLKSGRLNWLVTLCHKASV